MGESIFEGTITKWLKKPGDKVERDEPLFEISTDKVDAEIPSPSAGVLKEIKVGEGKTVPIQTVVGVIDAAGDGAGAAKAAAPAPAPAKAAEPPQAAAPAPATKPAATPPPAPGPRPTAPAPAAAAPASSAPAKEGARIHSSPLVRRMAKEHGVDLSAVPGTGSGGRISKQDIEAYIAGGGSAGEAEPAEADVYTPPAAASAPPRAAGPAQVPPPGSGGQTHVAF
jgi:2-oxoglutarate dehydrogenase E2 component (dihydrolipoamide succinyltransferase)